LFGKALEGNPYARPGNVLENAVAIATPEELIQSYIDACNRFDLDGMCALLASDIRFEHHANGTFDEGCISKIVDRG